MTLGGLLQYPHVLRQHSFIRVLFVDGCPLQFCYI